MKVLGDTWASSQHEKSNLVVELLSFKKNLFPRGCWKERRAEFVCWVSGAEALHFQHCRKGNFQLFGAVPCPQDRAGAVWGQ